MLRKLCLFVTLLAFCGLVGMTGCSKEGEKKPADTTKPTEGEKK